MPPKKTETKSEGAAAAKPKSASHPSYQDMITDAIIALKDRNGSSRQSLKKYVRANHAINVSDAMFDSLFNKALKAGVEKGVFEQPKGPSGGTKLARKAAKPAAPKKAAAPKKESAAKKEGKEKKPAAKKAAPKKEPAAKEAKEKKPAAPKKEKKAAAPKKAQAAPAVVDKPTVLTKTKSGRVAKTAAKPAAPKKAAPKKAAAPKKEKTPKKTEKAEAASA
ncbi:d58f6466-010c-4001-b06e-ed52963c43a4 [Thermothielavioides terrestris]|uniref:Histone H1 n=2 Tax=Thermothielavioides terrestris TaxID=2587410 RepID=G2R7Y5_THETT|nr:histone H1-like protein [Thermothielavioides terrestris NRRL 8126]AEO68044.1 histone H1-like protein [Thermothielavioides terrestris NRRL 8126]SPQ24715.1 d58f6466-010c-4001-b06e-ed52963c43a4 [Thermothielavioides terrestris]